MAPRARRVGGAAAACAALLAAAAAPAARAWPGDDGSEALAAVEVFRHGDRTPIATFATDAYQPATWLTEPGQLTPRGMRAHYETGERLRKRWGDDWLGSYSPSKVFVRSTDVNRTLQSAFSQLAGLFPEGTGPLAYAPAHPDEPRPTGVRANEPALPNRGQPVAITSVAAPRDHMLRAWDNCGRFREYPPL